MINTLILYPISLIVQGIIFVRNTLYDLKILPSIQSTKKVVSIGNIELGGAGKTPFVIAFIKQLIDNNIKPVVITRGYKRKTKHQIIFEDLATHTATEVGDEPYYIKYVHKQVPIIIDHNKKRAIKTANKMKQIDCIIIDDGFQSRYVKRNVDVVLINGRHTKNYFKLMPLGYLREPISNLKRADYIYTTKGSQLDASLFKSYNPKQLKMTFNLIQYKNGLMQNVSINKIDDPNYKVAFCGIAHGQHFIESLNKLNIIFDEKFIFRNHTTYNEQKIKMLTLDNKKNISFITTYKDFFKLDKGFINKYTVYVLEMNLQLDENVLIEKINL